MKKIFISLITAIVLISFTACGGTEPTDPPVEEEKNEVEEAAYDINDLTGIYGCVIDGAPGVITIEADGSDAMQVNVRSCSEQNSEVYEWTMGGTFDPVIGKMEYDDAVKTIAASENGSAPETEYTDGTGCFQFSWNDRKAGASWTDDMNGSEEMIKCDHAETSLNAEDLIGQWGRPGGSHTPYNIVYFRENGTLTFCNINYEDPDGELIPTYEGTWQIDGRTASANIDGEDWTFFIVDDKNPESVAKLWASGPSRMYLYVRTEKGIIPES